jgi:hypothetical protein
MHFQFKGDGDGIHIRLELKWRVIGAMIAAITALAATPGIHRIGTLLGWW